MGNWVTKRHEGRIESIIPMKATNKVFNKDTLGNSVKKI